jgi:acyl carrier protein
MMNNNEKVQKAIFSAVEGINTQLTDEEKLEINKDSILYGSKGKLDSLGLINLIVTVEQNIEDDFDITITLADERAMSQEHSPFRTIKTLTDYIEILLEEKLND